MGYFDACANPFRSDSVGRRVMAPFRRLGSVYLVPDDADAERIKRGMKWMQISALALVFVVVGPTAGIRPILLLAIIPLIWIGQSLWVHRLTRGLTVADEKYADLPRIPRREAVARLHAAMGKPALWTIQTLSLAMNGGFLWAALHYGDWKMWAGAALFTLFNGAMLFDYLQARSYRNSLQVPHSA